MEIKDHAGIVGMFSDNQAEGAYPNGTRIEKVWSEEGDMTPLGTKGTVLGSLGPIPFQGDPEMYGYFIEWDNAPAVAVFTIGRKVALATEGSA